MSRGASSGREEIGRHRSPTSAGATKDAILDSAEVLFSQNNVTAVTMRSVADAADVDPASITYHFGGRTELMIAVIRRRYTMLREHQMSALTRLLAESEEIPTARQLLDTVYRPWFELAESGEHGWRSYSKLIAAMPDSPVLQELVNDLSGQWESGLNAALRRAYPHADEELIVQAFTLTLGAALFVAAPPRMPQRNRDAGEPADLSVCYPDFLDFVSSGFESLVSAPN